MQASTRRKVSIIRIFSIAGLLVPLIFMAHNWIAFSRDRNHIPWMMRYEFYVWPSSIMLMLPHDDNNSIHTLIVLCISITANVLLYTMIGALVKGITVAWRRHFKAA